MNCQYEAFKLNPEGHYLNCAYMSPMLRVQEEVAHDVLGKCLDPSRIQLKDFFDPVHEIKELFARISNSGSPERIAIIPSVSYGIATVTRNVSVSDGDNIVMVAEQFPSNVYAWKELQQRARVELRFVSKPIDRTLWTDRVVDAIDASTAIVAIPHVHWADGSVYDLPRIAQRARECSALLIIDGTQSVGALNFPFEEVQPDALICAGYKWLLGPYSIGCAYYGPWFDDKEPIEYNWINRKDSDDFRKLVDYQDEYRQGAARFSVGENSNFMLTPILAKGMEQILDWGIDNINAYCRKLTANRLEEWKDLGFKLNADSEFSPHLFGIGLPDHINIHELKQAMDKARVHVSLRGHSVRVSPHVYNNKADINALHQVLQAASKGVPA